MQASPAPSKSVSKLRALRFLAAVALTLSVFEACSGEDGGSAVSSDGPASVNITSISLGKGDVLAGGSDVLGCDYTITVALELPNWNLRPPGVCALPQCGQVRVSLLDSTGATLFDRVSASAGVSLDVRALFEPNADGSSRPAGSYAVRAELVDDSGKPFNPGDGGNGSAEKDFQLSLPESCDVDGAAGAAGTVGAAGASAAQAGEGGAAGAGGSGASAAGTTSAGDGSGGAADVAGAGGA